MRLRSSGMWRREQWEMEIVSFGNMTQVDRQR
jgi:hypothetical protein